MPTKDLLLATLKRCIVTLEQLKSSSKFPLTISGNTIDYNDVVRALLNSDVEFPIQPIDGKLPRNFYPMDILYEAQNFLYRSLGFLDHKDYESVRTVNQWSWITVRDDEEGPVEFRDLFGSFFSKNDPETLFMFDERSVSAFQGMIDEISTIIPIIAISESEQELSAIEFVLDRLEMKIDLTEKGVNSYRYCASIYIAKALHDKKSLRDFDDGRVSDCIQSIISLADSNWDQKTSFENIGDLFDSFKNFAHDTKAFFIGASKNVQNLLTNKKWKKYNANIIYTLYEKYGGEAEVSENTPTNDPVIVIKEDLPQYLSEVRDTLREIGKNVISPLEKLPDVSQDDAIAKAFASLIDEKDNDVKLPEQIIRGMRRQFAKALYTANGADITPYGFSVQGYAETGKLPKVNYLIARIFVRDPEDKPQMRPINEIVKSADSFEILRKHGHEFVMKEMQEGIRFTEDTLRYGDLGRLKNEFKEGVKGVDDKGERKDLNKIRSIADRLIKELDFMKKYVIEMHKLVPTFHGRIINLLGGCYEKLIEKEAIDSATGGNRDRKMYKMDQDKGVGLKLGENGVEVGRKFGGSKVISVNG